MALGMLSIVAYRYLPAAARWWARVRAWQGHHAPTVSQEVESPTSDSPLPFLYRVESIHPGLPEGIRRRYLLDAACVILHVGQRERAPGEPIGYSRRVLYDALKVDGAPQISASKLAALLDWISDRPGEGRLHVLHVRPLAEGRWSEPELLLTVREAEDRLRADNLPYPALVLDQPLQMPTCLKPVEPVEPTKPVEPASYSGENAESEGERIEA